MGWLLFCSALGLGVGQSGTKIFQETRTIQASINNRKSACVKEILTVDASIEEEAYLAKLCSFCLLVVWGPHLAILKA